MRKRDTSAPKHVHLWKLAKDEPATKPSDTIWVPLQARDRVLTRECQVCGARSYARVIDDSVIVPGYESISDLPWEERHPYGK